MSLEEYPELAAKAPLPKEGYFSESYVEARAKFLCAAKVLSSSAAVKTHKLLVKEPDYTMDIVVVTGTSGKGLLVHSSGVHGVEGYAGSAIQTSVLHGMHCSGQIPKVTCVFVHAVNPYGMAHFRRWNENNVDLNRNALTPEGLAEVLGRDRNIAGYEDFKSLLVPESAPSWFYVNIGVWWQTLTLLLRYGMRHLKRCLVTGTYFHETGVFFGGKELQPSHALLSKFMTDNFGSIAGSEVVWMDVHTGLGPKGADVLLAATNEMDALVSNFPGSDIQCVEDSKQADNQAAGYELARGFVKTYYGNCFDSSQGEAVIATQEFGTLPGVMMARNMIIENRGYHFDFANHEYWRTFTRDCFYVREPGWKDSVLKRGKIVFEQLVSMSMKRSKL